MKSVIVSVIAPDFRLPGNKTGSSILRRWTRSGYQKTANAGRDFRRGGISDIRLKENRP
jgi:hypothetical protein